MKENLQKYALIAEIVSAVAIVVSLVFVGLQIQQANRISRAEAYRIPTSDINAINATYIAIPNFQSGFQKVIDGNSRDALEANELIVVDSYMISLSNIFAQLSREVREGVLDPVSIENFSGGDLLRSPYYQESWVLYRNALDPNFVREYEDRNNISN